jgi:hypothetical protein
MKTRSNKSTRIYTIWINGVKYTTLPMSKIEFDEAYFNTINDWKNYLKTI